MTTRLTIVAAVVLVAMALFAGLYWKGRRDGERHERPKIDAAQVQAKIAGLETQGARLSVRQQSDAVRRTQNAAAATTRLTAQSLNSEAAHAPLNADRLARLRGNDRELCVTAPELAGCAADRDAGRGEAPVQPL